MRVGKGQLLEWALDALKIGLAWIGQVYISPFFENLAGPIPDVIVELGVIVVFIFLANIGLNILFGLPKISIFWKDPDQVAVSGDTIEVVEGDNGFHAMEAVYECKTFASKLINSFLARRANLVITFDPSAVRVVPEIGLSRDGASLDALNGKLVMSLDSTVQNGPVTWCAVQIEPLSVHHGYTGAIEYRVVGTGAAMVVWGWIIRPATDVRKIHVTRSSVNGATQ